MSLRSLTESAAQAGNAARAAATAASTSDAVPAWISASGCSSIGEMSVKVLADATRCPPIQCRVSTWTPSTIAWCSWSLHLGVLVLLRGEVSARLLPPSQTTPTWR